MSLSSFGQNTTISVKKQEQIKGLYYQKLEKNHYKYLRFEGDSVSVWKSSTRPGEKEEYSYSDFVKSDTKRNKTAYQISDSLLTFTFSKKEKNGNYTFLDYHCILDGSNKLVIKKGSTVNTVKIEVYYLSEPKKRWRWFRKKE